MDEESTSPGEGLGPPSEKLLNGSATSGLSRIADRHMWNSVELDREKVRRGGLKAFVVRAWPIVETGRFIDSWHIDLMCDRLEQVTSGKIKRLIINIPPGCFKSLLVNVFWPTWEWIFHPKIRWMYASYHGDLVGRDARRTRKLIQSEWFQERWGLESESESDEPGVAIDKTGESAEKALLFFTTAGGFRYSTTVGGGGIGWHAHRQVIDDPIKPEAAAAISGTDLKRVNSWFGSTMASRKADPDDFARVIIMQRLHEMDLSGYCLSKTEEHWEHLCLSMKYDPNHPHLCPDDPRTEPGELLWPAFKDAEEVESEGREMGPYVRSAQHDQHPSPPGGGVFKRLWFGKRWRELPAKMKYFIQSWDHTLGSISEQASFVVGQLWGVYEAEFYLIDQVRDRMTFPEMKQAVIDFTAKHPQAIVKVFENKATGPSIKQELDKTIPGIVLQSVDATTGGKLARAHAVSGLCEAGNVWIPDPINAKLKGRPHPCPWVLDFVERIVKFRGVKADVADEVDAKSQALIRLSGKGAGRFVQAMTQARADREATKGKNR